MSVRGQVRMLRSDRGTNFIGAKRELEECVELVKSNAVKELLLKHDCDIQFGLCSTHLMLVTLVGCLNA